MNNLIGLKFGKLTIIKYIDKHHVECICDCGNKKIVNIGNLKSGGTKSCGCLVKEQSSKNGKISAYKVSIKNRKYSDLPYDKTQKRLYSIYHQILGRCYNEKNPKYKRYGERGIKMCDEWKRDFRNFYYWAINNGFDINLSYIDCSIDRINNDGNYEPSNCRWVNQKVQQNNRENVKLIVYNNQTHTISEWIKILNIKIKPNTLRARINRGWSIEKAFNKSSH